MKFRHSGDLGDIVYALGVIRRFNDGPHRLCLVDRNKVPPFTSLLTFRSEVIAPLIRAQPYIESCVCSEEEVDLDLSHFRPLYVRSNSLQWMQFEYAKIRYPDLKIDRGSEAWLQANPDNALKGRVIVARSPRYNNGMFPWHEVVKKYRDRILFVGLDVEYNNFCAANGNVERMVVENYLKLAEAMKGAEMFIGNQSSPFSVAEGLKVRRILEVCETNPDCVYLGGDVQHVTYGEVILPGIDGEPDTHIKKDVMIDEHRVPRGGWQFPDLPPNTFFELQAGQVARIKGVSKQEAKNLLASYNASIHPEFFARKTLGHFEMAQHNAAT